MFALWRRECINSLEQHLSEIGDSSSIDRPLRPVQSESSSASGEISHIWYVEQGISKNTVEVSPNLLESLVSSPTMSTDNLSFVLRGVEDVVFEQRPIPESLSLALSDLLRSYP